MPNCCSANREAARGARDGTRAPENVRFLVHFVFLISTKNAPLLSTTRSAMAKKLHADDVVPEKTFYLYFVLPKGGNSSKQNADASNYKGK